MRDIEARERTTCTSDIAIIISDINICIMYVMKLVISPVVIMPFIVRFAPKKNTAIMHPYMQSCIIGPLSIISFSAYT